MKSKRFCVLTLSIVLAFCVCVPSWSQTEVLFEDWNAGTVDAGKWDVVDLSDGEAQLLDLGGGDWAFYTSATSGTFQERNAFFSVDSFDRGNNIYCEFIAWGNLSLDGWQGNFPLVASIDGPWRQVGADEHSPPSVPRVEAGVVEWINQPIRFGQGMWGMGPTLSSGYNSTWAGAIGKENAILHRVYLDDTLGARMQWSTDGGANWNLEVDSRGDFGGTQLTGIHVGFASFGAAVLIDDIRVVINDVNPPKPTPPDPNAPGPMLCEDWNSGVVDPGAWLVSLQLETMFESGQSVGLEEFDPVGFPGDFAMHTKGPDSSLTGSDSRTNIYTFHAYPRGENVYCEFKCWGDNDRRGWAGSTIGSHYAINGPWHFGRGFLWHESEATIRYWNAYSAGPPVAGQEFGQPGEAFNMGESQVLSQAYHDAFVQATSREQCMQIRIELGSSNGASCEWRSPGIGITDYQFEINNLGVPPQNATGVSHPNNFIGFGTYSGLMFYDDIKVLNNNSTGPTHTPTIAPTPTATSIVSAVDNWEQLE